MKYITSTLYNWFGDDSSTKSQLYIYAVENGEEYLELRAMIDESREDKILERLGYYSDKSPVECIGGNVYTLYSCALHGSFLVITENIIIDI